MPFQNESAVDQKLQFIHEWMAKEAPFSNLCERYGISRPTGYKWVERYRGEGSAGLEERTHASKEHRNALDKNIETMIVRARGKHPTWGPKKLIAWIKQREGLEHVCAISTAHGILQRHGLVCARKRHRHTPLSSEPLGEYKEANDIWCVDYKGWFLTGNGQRCDPFTMTDGFSRYLLRCQAFERIGLENTWRVCEAAFREFGLPRRIRSDNGAPFGSVAIGGLSALAVWWMKLGIVPERIEPGRPDQNGRHERMHLTLLEAVKPPSYDLRAQQRRFDKFRDEYNDERPHESLKQNTPSSVYETSPRRYSGHTYEPKYDEGVITRRIQKRGEFKWQGNEVFLSETLRGEDVAFIPIADGKLEMRFCKMVLGTFDERTLKIVAKDSPKRRRKKKHA